MKPTKEEAAHKRQVALWQFVRVLREAGNTVDEEVAIENEAHPAYPFRVDYVVNSEIAVELQGFGFGHVGRAGWLRDIRKTHSIAAKGWLLVKITHDDVANGDALHALAKCGVNVEPRIKLVDCGGDREVKIFGSDGP